MDFIKRILRIALISVLLYSVLIVLGHPHKSYYESPGGPFSPGNASEPVRSQIIQQLHAFQDGYTLRDTSRLKAYMEQLFSQENLLILGTQPREILKSHERATALVSSDWRTWGDCTFLMDDAHISTFGDVAWISTIGYVQFDMSRFLVLPLRLSGVMVKESGLWKFQHMQFQFDLDVSSLLLTIVVLLIWVPLSVLFLIIAVVRRLRKAHEQGDSVVLQGTT